MFKYLREFRALAVEKYEDGYDVFVEAYTDDELEEFFEDCTTYEAVLIAAKGYVEMREEMRGECF